VLSASPDGVTAALAKLRLAAGECVTADPPLHMQLPAQPVIAGQRSQSLLESNRHRVAVSSGYNAQKQEESLEESDTADELLLLTCSSVIHDVAMEQLAQVLRLTVTTIDGELCALTDVRIDEAERKIYGRGQKISTYGEYV
jgi:hypothetical protein